MKRDLSDLTLIDDAQSNVAAAQALGWRAHLYQNRPQDQIS
ncbi:MAG: hypothetical protein AAGG57_20300 [Pseudomonadota bacterium]